MRNIKKVLTHEERAQEISDYTKPIASPEEVAERSTPVNGYLRMVDFGDSILIETKMKLSDLRRGFLSMMESDEDLAKVIQNAAARFEMRQTAEGKLLDQLMEMVMSEDEPCHCKKCTDKRKNESEQEKAE